LIIADDMRADLGSYGHSDPPPTPSLDRFARSSRVFRRAYAQVKYYIEFTFMYKKYPPHPLSDYLCIVPRLCSLSN
jgi:hypothetical protein